MTSRTCRDFARPGRTLACVFIGACVLYVSDLAAADVGSAQTQAGAASELAGSPDLPPRHWSVRLAGGIAQPLADLANEEPRDGWVGGQSLGYALHGGVRVPLLHELFVRPELSFYGFGDFRDTDVPTLIFDETGAEPDTVASDWTRKALMAGVRVHLDYIPADRGLVSPFLTGALGLVYMRFDDEIIIEGEPYEQNDEALGLSASAGVGLLVGHAELVVQGTFQEPGFTDVGAVSWFTIDMSLGFALPIPR